jgi:hypothetical protein
MFFTTVAALLYTSFSLFSKIGGMKTTEAKIGNTFQACIGLFLVIAAIVLAVEGVKAFARYRAVKAQAAPAKA